MSRVLLPARRAQQRAARSGSGSRSHERRCIANTIYRLEHEELDSIETPPQLAEILLVKIEGMVVPHIDRLIADETDRLGVDGRDSVSTYVATQLTRGRSFRARMQQMSNDSLRLIWRGAGEDHLRRFLGAAGTEAEIAEGLPWIRMLEAGDIQVCEPVARLTWMSLEFGTTMAPILSARPWGVWKTESEFVTTDEPVVALGGRLTARGQVGGAHAAHLIMFPLGPSHLLVIANPATWEGELDGTLTADETRQVNLDLLAHAHRWRFSRPRVSQLPAFPPPVPPSILETDISVKGQPDKSLVHGFTPNRWLYAPDQPWPVQPRWPPGAFRETPARPWMAGMTAEMTDRHTDTQ